MRRVATGGWAILFALQVALAVAAEAPLEPLLARANALSASGRTQDAYAVLAGAEEEHLGNPRFDYALGRAALEAGYPARATLAFARVLALEPHHAGALIDSGRSFLSLGNLEQARATFESLLALDPPPALRAQLHAYLDQARRGASSPPSLAGYVAAGLGHSTNVNQSPSQAQVFVPLFDASFDLAAENVRRADAFWSLGAGLEGSVPLTGPWSLIGGVDALLRQNASEQAFDLGGLGARGGVSFVSGLDLYRVQWVAARNYVGGAANREIDGLAAEGFKTIGPDDQVLGAVQAGRIRYVPQGLAVLDADYALLGIGLSHRTAASWVLSAGMSAGQERDAGGNPDGNKGQLGLRGAVDVPLARGWTAGVSAGWNDAGYDRTNPAFLVERRDRRTDVELTLHHVLREGLSLRVGLTAVGQRSSIPIYSFDRREVWAIVRRDFR